MSSRVYAANRINDLAGITSALVALTKPGVTRLVVLTTALGAAVAPGAIRLHALLVTVVGTVLVVASANALNMVLERDVDALMTRTKDRPLPSGRLSMEVALVFGMVLGGTGIALLGLGATPLAGEIAVMALVTYVLIYTPMKAVSPISLYLGAVPGALPPLLGYAGMNGTLTPAAWSLFAILFVWQVPHFLAIAVFRAEEYARAGLKVLPVVAGLERTRHAIAISSLALVLVTFLPTTVGLGGVTYFLTAAVSGVAFLFWAIRGARREQASQAGVEQWARSLFFASMPHLVVLFTALALTAP